jgi:hypothetical protein
MELFGILVKETGTLLTKKGKPQLWKNMRGPAQVLGKKQTETTYYKIVKVQLIIGT